MKVIYLGTYSGSDETSYEVEQCVTQVVSKSNQLDVYNGFSKYRTRCGINLNKRKNDFVTSDGIILKVVG
jgi:hypothetical protein